jgi:hypothetical protein
LKPEIAQVAIDQLQLPYSMKLIFQFDLLRTACDKCLHLIKFRFSACLKPA